VAHRRARGGGGFITVAGAGAASPGRHLRLSHPNCEGQAPGPATATIGCRPSARAFTRSAVAGRVGAWLSRPAPSAACRRALPAAGRPGPALFKPQFDAAPALPTAPSTWTITTTQW